MNTTNLTGDLRGESSEIRLAEKQLARIFIVAHNAAFEALPPESKARIEEHDRLHNKWKTAGWPVPIPAALQKATELVEADMLARAVFELRQKGNALFFK